MKFLCLDTTLNNCSIHIISSQKELLNLSDKNQPPSDIIPRLVSDALLDLKLTPTDIDGIVVATGPGNFTSLRVGISFGVGLAKAIAVPIYGVSSLEGLILSHEKILKKNQKFLVSIKARGEDYFFQLFDNNSIAFSKPIKANINKAKELYSEQDLFFLGSGSRDVAVNFNQKEKIICNEDDINFFEVYKNIKENLLNYKDNVWPLYLADPVAEKKDPLWFAKKKN